MITTISNPPFNMKWEIPCLARMEERFSQTEIPPANNANFAFVLTALNESDRCVFILPTNSVSSKDKAETEIRKYLVENNLIDAVIICPNNMFESTGVGVSILVLDKNKKDSYVELIDLKSKATVENREQKGQFGGKAHTNRVYEKSFNTISDETIEEVKKAIKDRETIKDFCVKVSINDIREKQYRLNAGGYFEITIEDTQHRSYDDIINDLNEVIKEKNKCKLTINETLAKQIGFDVETYKQQLNIEIPKQASEIKVLKEDYISFTKNKNQVVFSNNSKEEVSSIFMMIFQMWKQHLYYLNIQENRYLAELRDALLPDLMSGKIELSDESKKAEEIKNVLR